LTLDPVAPHLRRLLATIIDSVERLDVLLFLRRERPKSFSPRAAGAALGIPATSAERDLAHLCGHGFLSVSIGSDLVYTYMPASPELGRNVDELAKLWSSSRAAVTACLPTRVPGPSADS
jgi:hypothetical protein